MKFAVRKVVALLLAILMFVPSVASFAEGTVDYSDTVSTYTLDPEFLSVEEAIQEVYDEYIAELQAMATYEERYTWLNNAKNNPPSELGDFFYADFIAYYNTNNPDGDLICVCENPVAYGAEGHDAACRWSAESIAADDAITAVYDEYIAELKAMTSYADRYAWLYSAKNEPASDLGDYFYADFIAYYNEKEPTGDAMCVCAEPLVYGADGHTEGCRWNINNLVIVPGASASSGSASVSGELPAGATLSVTSSESAPAAFTGLFETDKGAYTDTQYNSYDLKIMVGDQQWQPGSKVAVTLANVWSGEGTPAVYVYHFIDVASAIDSDCIISYDSDLVSAYPEAAAAAAEAGYANAVAYEVFSTIDGTATYNSNNVTFSLDSFSDVATVASAEAYSDILVEGYEAELAYISNTENCPTMQDVYAYLATDKAAGEGGIEAYYNDFYSGFAAWYKTTYPTGTMLCTCTTCVYDENNVMTDCPPYQYDTTAHEETCPWHSNNVVVEGTLSASTKNGTVYVTGEWPADATEVKLVAEVKSVPDAAIALFESLGGDASEGLYSAYNLKILVDGVEYQPESSVTVKVPAGWTGDTDSGVEVFHFIDTASAVKTSCLHTAVYDADLVSAYPAAANAASNAGYSGAVVYELLSSDNGLASYDSTSGYVTFSLDSFSDITTFDRHPGESTSTSGTMGHLEVEIAASAVITIDGVTYHEVPEITTGDVFTVIAEYTSNGSTSKVTVTEDSGSSTIAGSTIEYTDTTTGNGSNNGATVELTGSWPTGTIGNPVYYTITVTKDVTFYLRNEDGNYIDEDGNELELDENGDVIDTDKLVEVITLPITMSVTTSYWDNEGIGKNECPGVTNGSNWQNGYFLSESGIDVAIAGSGGSLLLTKGKLMITKDITNNSSDTTGFRFYLQYKDSEGGAQKYVTFSNGVYTDLSDTLTDACYVSVAAGSTVTLTELPVGYYKVTEIQQEGYIIANVNDTNTSTNYSTDFIEVTKTDSVIPVAVFKNKELTEEAGISIRKVASGASYPASVNVSIYEADANGNPTGTAVWSGTLVTNGDIIYLGATLSAAKTYVIVESGHVLTGYGCSTTISGGETVNGMTFTVAAGKRYDLTVNNVYENTKSVTAVKQWVGDTAEGDSTLVYATRPGSITLQLKADGVNYGDAVSVTQANGWSYTWTDLPRSANGEEIEYRVEETAVPGYTTTYDTDENGNLVVKNTLNTTSVTLKKLVSGNLGDRSKEFTFTVTVKDANNNEYTYHSVSDNTLAHDQTATISNVPVGGTIVITETNKDGYTVSYEITNGSTVKGSGSGSTATYGTNYKVAAGDLITFTNDLTVTVDTGILLDSAPYVLLLALVGAGIAFMIIRRRRRED